MSRVSSPYGLLCLYICRPCGLIVEGMLERNFFQITGTTAQKVVIATTDHRIGLFMVKHHKMHTNDIDVKSFSGDSRGVEK